MRLTEPEAQPVVDEAARKRAAVELIARHEGSLKQTARRFSLCADDAEDAYQRAMEILLTKAPTAQPHELSRWTHTVIRHEALAIRRNRERLLGTAALDAGRDGHQGDWVELIPTADDGPDGRVERRERIARSREALQALKPAELRALTLLAEGYSYAEIGERTGWSYTKVNRCLAEGRERFRRLVARSEDGSRCAEMSPVLSAFCDGEASDAEAMAVREHLRACAHCRAALRAYRATPAAAAVLVPALPAARTLLDRAHEALAWIQLRLPGGGGAVDSTAAQMATAGGARGMGLAALAKVLAVCAGTAGGAAACVATGIVPAPIDLSPDHAKQPTVERVSRSAIEGAQGGGPVYVPAAEPPSQPPSQQPPQPETDREAGAGQAEDAVQPAAAGAVEYAPPVPTPSPASNGESPEPSSGSAAGEFGP